MDEERLAERLLRDLPEGHGEGTPCDRAEAVLGLVEGTLPDPEAEAARAHLSTCAACRELWIELGATIAASPKLSSLRAEGGSPLRFLRPSLVAVAAAVVAAIGAFLIIDGDDEPTPGTEALTGERLAEALEDVRRGTDLPGLGLLDDAQVASIVAPIEGGGATVISPQGLVGPKPLLATRRIAGATAYSWRVIGDDGGTRLAVTRRAPEGDGEIIVWRPAPRPHRRSARTAPTSSS